MREWETTWYTPCRSMTHVYAHFTVACIRGNVAYQASRPSTTHPRHPSETNFLKQLLFVKYASCSPSMLTMEVSPPPKQMSSSTVSVRRCVSPGMTPAEPTMYPHTNGVAPVSEMIAFVPRRRRVRTTEMAVLNLMQRHTYFFRDTLFVQAGIIDPDINGLSYERQFILRAAY